MEAVGNILILGKRNSLLIFIFSNIIIISFAKIENNTARLLQFHRILLHAYELNSYCKFTVCAHKLVIIGRDERRW